MLRHPAAEILKAYDEKNTTELYRTLFTYLQMNQNIVHTAQKLFVHRNTLMNRIVRIQELTGIDLVNFDENLRIELTYMMDSLS